MALLIFILLTVLMSLSNLNGRMKMHLKCPLLNRRSLVKLYSWEESENSAQSPVTLSSTTSVLNIHVPSHRDNWDLLLGNFFSSPVTGLKFLTCQNALNFNELSENVVGIEEFIYF